MTHLTVAFASPRHARDALAFLASGVHPFRAVPREATDPSTALALVDIELPCGERDRLLTLLSGVHGIVVADTPALAVSVA
jgi:hypothetical protein